MATQPTDPDELRDIPSDEELAAIAADPDYDPYDRFFVSAKDLVLPHLPKAEAQEQDTEHPAPESSRDA